MPHPAPHCNAPSASPSSRRAWIEITDSCEKPEIIEVALLAEGVDRNRIGTTYYFLALVALLAEGVDRNNFNFAGVRPNPGRPPRGGRG